MTTAIHGCGIPDAIVRKLNQLIWRGRLVVTLRGAMAVLATAVCAVLTIMAIDRWVVIFSDTLRWALSLSGLGLTALVAMWRLIRPLARSFTLAGVARLIESRHPELHERLSSTVELLTSRDGPDLRGSDAMIAALAQEAVADAGRVRPAREVNFRAAVPYLVAAGSVLTVLLGLIAIWPDEADRLFRRALMANVSRVSHTALRLTKVAAPDLLEWRRDGVDYVMLAGRRLHVELEVDDPAVTEAALRMGGLKGGEESILAMTRLPDGPDGQRRFAATCAAADRDFRFRVHAGDALTRYHAVRVVEQPAIGRIDLRYEYPAYTGKAAEVRSGGSGDVAAVAGSDVTVTARANKPVAAAEFLVDGRRIDGEPGQADGAAACTFRIHLAKDLKARWSAKLTDEYGFASEPREYGIRALSDGRPEVRVVVPKITQLKLKPTDKLPIAGRLKDDFGLASAELLVDVDGRRQTPVAVALPDFDELSRAAGEEGKPLAAADCQLVLDLSALPLEGARQVTFRLRATDLLPPELGGPQEGLSEVFTIQLDVQAASFAEQVVMAEELRLREMLQKVLELLQEAKKDSAPLRSAVPKAKTVTEAIITRVDRMRKNLGAADTILRQAMQDTTSLYENLIEKLSTLANDHVAKAIDLAGQIKLTDQLKQRSTLADEADFQVDRAIAIVNELLKELGAMTDLMARAMELEALAERQEALADALAEMGKLPDANQSPAPPAGQPMNEADWKKAQEDLAGKLADMTRKTPGASEAALRRDQKQTKDLVGEARKLAREQAELRQETERATRVEKIDESLKALADRQKALGKEAAASPAAADQAKPMTEAAEQIKAGKLDEAVGRQQSAEGELGKRADQGAKARTAADLANQAEQIARQQKGLSQRAEAARGALRKAESAGQEAAKQAEAAKGQAAKDPAAAQRQQAEAQQKQQTAAEQAEAARQQDRNLAGEQHDLGRRAGELAQRAAQAGPAAQAAAQRHNPSNEMKQAERALQQAQADEAARQAAAAAEKARQLAEALRQASEQAPKAAREAPEQLADLARRQAQLRQETQRLLAERKQQTDAAAQRELARLQREQAQLAEEAGKLADAVKKDAPQADRIETDAARQAREAAEKLSARQPAAAAESASQAGENLGQLARRLDRQTGRPERSEGQQPGESSAKPSGEQVAAKGSSAQEPEQVGGQDVENAARKAELADTAGDLSRRQRQLARQMQAMAQANPSAMTAARQEGLGERTAELARDVGRIQEHAEELIPDEPPRREAAEAARQLGKAQAAQAEAGKALQAGKPQQALAPEERGVTALSAAAAALERLGQQLAQSAAKHHVPEPAEDSQDMADAYNSADQAAESRAPSDAELAAAQLKALAQAAAAKAQAMGMTVGQMSPEQMAQMLAKASMNIDSKHGTGPQAMSLSAAKLEKLGISLADWARLPGSLRDQVLQAADSKAPEEYRQLIRRYFREVARRGGAGGAGTSDTEN